MQETHTITIKGGKATVKVEGVPGQGCKASTEELERKLGNVISDVETEEMYEQSRIVQDTRI